MRFEYTQENIEYVMKLIRKNLTPDLLATKFRQINQINPMYGHCKHASQTLILLMNMDRLKLMKNSTQVWVQDDNQIYDVVVDQFYSQGLIPCYENAEHAKYSHTVKVDSLIERVLGTHCKLSTPPSDPPQPAL